MGAARGTMPEEARMRIRRIVFRRACRLLCRSGTYTILCSSAKAAHARCSRDRSSAYCATLSPGLLRRYTSLFFSMRVRRIVLRRASRFLCRSGPYTILRASAAAAHARISCRRSSVYCATISPGLLRTCSSLFFRAGSQRKTLRFASSNPPREVFTNSYRTLSHNVWHGHHLPFLSGLPAETEKQ